MCLTNDDSNIIITRKEKPMEDCRSEFNRGVRTAITLLNSRIKHLKSLRSQLIEESGTDRESLWRHDETERRVSQMFHEIRSLVGLVCDLQRELTSPSRDTQDM